MKPLLILFATTLFIGAFNPTYGQTTDSVYTKMKEYNKMLEDGLITQEDYERLKNQLLFPSNQVETQKTQQQNQQQQNPQPIIINFKKQITKSEYSTLKYEYQRKVNVGKGRVAFGTILLAGSITCFALTPFLDNKRALYITGGITGGLSLPLIITGGVKMAKNRSNLFKLDTEYEIIATK